MGKARPAAPSLEAEEEAVSQGTQVLLGTRKGKETASRRSRARPTPGFQLAETRVTRLPSALQEDGCVLF